MKKTRPPSDEMRTEYRRDELEPLVRGKYEARYARATNIVVIDPAVTKAFPNTEVVSEALHGVLALAALTTGPGPHPKQPARKRTAA